MGIADSDGVDFFMLLDNVAAEQVGCLSLALRVGESGVGTQWPGP